MEVVKLLVDAGASPMDKSIEGKTPIVLAVASEHVDVYNYLINKKHDSYKLLEDKKVSELLTTFLSRPQLTLNISIALCLAIHLNKPHQRFTSTSRSL